MNSLKIIIEKACLCQYALYLYTMTKAQEIEVKKFEAYFKSIKSIVCDEKLIIETEPSIKYFDGTDAAICLTVRTISESRYTVTHETYCDVVIGARGSVKGKFDRDEPIKTYKYDK